MRIEDLSDIEILNYLAKGIDLYTGEKLGNDHFLRNPAVVSALYEGMMALQGPYKKSSNRNIILTASILNSIKRVEPYTTIKPLSINISQVINVTSGRLIKKIQDFLIERGDLIIRVAEDNATKYKFATESGLQKGFINGTYLSKNGQEYPKLQYTVAAQNYIISLLPEILEDYK